jgi:serine/threonine protein kinase
MTSAIGKYLQNGKYTLEQELGQGGFGITYLAQHNTLGYVVVIKTLNDSLRQDPKFWEFQRQFQDEARRLAKFSHPNIVRVTDFFVEESLPYIVMDFIPGQTLKTLVIPNNPLPETVAIHYIRQVANALKVVHQYGLLHRDVKPQNVILRQGTQEVVLIDFGIAREFTPGLTQTHTGVLSVGYAPIEQYLPRTKRTPATDVYGLAATLYTLLTAEVPVAATLRHRQTLPSPRELRPEISPMVNQAVLHGMAVEPEQRPATIDEWLSLLPSAQDSSQNSGASTSYHSPMSGEPTLAIAPPPPPNAHSNVYAASQSPNQAPPPPYPAHSAHSVDETAWSDAPPVSPRAPQSGASAQEPDAAQPKFNDRPWFIAGLVMLGALGAIVLGNIFLRTTQILPTLPDSSPTQADPTPPSPERPFFEAPPPPAEDLQPIPDSSPTPEASPTPETEEEDPEASPTPEATESPEPEESVEDPSEPAPPVDEAPEPPEPIAPESEPAPEPQATVDSSSELIQQLAPAQAAPVQSPPAQTPPEEVSDRGRGRDQAPGQNRAEGDRDRGSDKKEKKDTIPPATPDFSP